MYNLMERYEQYKIERKFGYTPAQALENCRLWEDLAELFAL